MLPVRAILHPTDFSDQADYAYGVARLIARESGAHLIVLHVVEQVLNLPQAVYTDMGLALDCSQDSESHHEALKKQLRERFETEPSPRAETRLIYGDAAAEIVRLAGEVPCDLIVMGTHGRSGLGRLLLGSVAEAVLRHA
ncbi:universal stress protein, partial [Singulisphaera rosea]